MLEVVQAHASYRFIIRDEENENIRILVSTPRLTICLAELIGRLDMVVQSVSENFSFRFASIRSAQNRVHPRREGDVQVSGPRRDLTC
jgi:hypothetical protein